MSPQSTSPPANQKVEYALQGSQQPIGVFTYQLQSQRPPNFQENLPTIE